MPKTKVAITLEADTIRRIDRLVRESRYPNRSQAIEAAANEMLRRIGRTRLAEECAKVDPAEEREWSELGIVHDMAQWPEY